MRCTTATGLLPPVPSFTLIRVNNAHSLRLHSLRNTHSSTAGLCVNPGRPLFAPVDADAAVYDKVNQPTDQLPKHLVPSTSSFFLSFINRSLSSGGVWKEDLLDIGLILQVICSMFYSYPARPHRYILYISSSAGHFYCYRVIIGFNMGILKSG
jgi:hypothetical protein